MQKSLAQIFNETCASAYGTFPQKLKKLVVLLVPSAETPIYVSPEVVSQLTNNISCVKKVAAQLSDDMHARNWAGLAIRRYPLGGTNFSLIALREDPPGIFSLWYTKEMRAIFVLDHEIGHHVVENGFPNSKNSGHLAECAADAYAALRHIQRFGKNTDLIEDMEKRNAGCIVLNSDAEHYTTDTMKKTVRLSKEMDILLLSPHETADLAAKIALETQIDAKILEKIRTAFLPVNRTCRTYIGGTRDTTDSLYQQDKTAYSLFCHATLAVMRQYRDDPDIFKAGRRFLNYPPIKQFMEEKAKTNIGWKDNLDFIAADRRRPIIIKTTPGPI